MICGLDRADVGHDRARGETRRHRRRRPRPPPPAACRSPPDRRPRPPRPAASWRDRRGRAPAPSRGSPRVRAQATISPASPARAQVERERAVDQPDADQRDALEAAAGRAHACLANSPQAVDHGLVLGLEADRQPQALRQAVGRHRARDDAVALEPGAGRGGAPSHPRPRTRPGRSWRCSGAPCRPRSASAPREPGQPAIVVGARALLMVEVLERGDARRPAPACRR